MSKRISDLWCEKYRPSSLDYMVINADVKRYFLSTKLGTQNILLIGSAGIGKTTLAKLVSTKLLSCQYIYINASDENGIDTIRTKVTNFVLTKSFDGSKKVVILDEADGLSDSSQQALRNIMEEYTDTSIFILTANYGHKIKDAIKSRCASFVLDFHVRDFAKHILTLLSKENISNLSDTVPLIKSFYPDFRRCLNELQKRKVDDLIVLDTAHTESAFAELLWGYFKDHTIDDIRKYIIEHETEFETDYLLLARQLFNCVCSSSEDEGHKSQVLIKLGEAMRNHPHITDTEINFFTSLVEIKMIYSC